MARSRKRDRTEQTATAPAPIRPVTEDKAEPQTLEEYRTEIRKALRDITADAELVQVLIDSRQRRMVDVDARAREAMASQIAEEQRARDARRRQEEHVGLGWMRPDETAKNHGPTAAPGDVSAISLSEEIFRTLRTVVIDLTDYDHVPLLAEITGLEKTRTTARRIRLYLSTVNEADLPALGRSYDALTQLLTDVTSLIDGHGQKSRLSAPCPHCDLETLVAFWDDQLIRCERETKAKHYAPCVCSDPLCECKTRSVSHRHVWYGPASQAGKTPSWYALSDRLNISRSITPTKK